MENLSDYVQRLDFEYALSYAGLRGEHFRELEKENKNEIKRIEKEIESARFMQQLKLRKKIQELEEEINIFNARIIDNHKALHKSCIQIHRFEKGDTEMMDILKTLSLKFEEQHFWMCPPIFRDAIVFYSSEDEIRGILQLCFSCSWIKNEKEEDFEVDHKIFPRLKNQLIQLGHKIE